MGQNETMTKYVIKMKTRMKEYSPKLHDQAGKMMISMGLDTWYQGRLTHLANDKEVTVE